MKYGNSNLNLEVLKQINSSKTIKVNDFKKSNIKNNFNIYSPTIKNCNNLLFNLLDRDGIKTSLYSDKHSIKFSNHLIKNKKKRNISINKKKNYLFNNKTNSCKNIYNSTYFGDALNNRGEIGNGHINIRLKLNSEIINNNNSSRRKRIFYKSSNLEVAKRIKEKDCQINRLQKDLFRSQELLNQLQKDKQKELSITYNSLKSFDSCLGNRSDFFTQSSEKDILRIGLNKKEGEKWKRKYDSLGNIFNIGSISTFSSIKNRNKNKHNNKTNKIITFKKKLNPNNIINSNTNNKKYHSPKSRGFTKYFSSSPNRHFSYGAEQYDSCLSSPSLNKKSIKKEIFFKNSSSSSRNRQINKYIKGNKKIHDQKIINFIERCEGLKIKAKEILINYIKLIENLN